MSQSLLSKNNKVLKGANIGNSWVNITLDTAAPEVDIESTLSYKNATALFEFTNGSVDLQKFKTWGDYDTSPSGINYDLCGTTELNAPLVDVRDDILFSLGNTSPVAQHTFYFKLIDDVWNEITVTVEGEYEPTVLVDASDFAKAKDCYFNVYLYYDSARISGSALVIEDEEDWFAYKEWVSGNEIFGKDFYSFREQLIGMLFTSDIGTLDSETYLKVNGIDTFYYEEAISDPPSVRPVVVLGREIYTAKDQSLLVFPAEHRTTSYDESIVDMPNIEPVSTKLSREYIVSKFIQTEPAKVHYLFLTGYENTDYSFEVSDATLNTATSDVGNYSVRPWWDLDYIAKDFGFGTDISVVAFYSDAQYSILDTAMLGLAFDDAGEQPNQPVWSFAVSVMEEVVGEESLMMGLLSLDFDYEFESALLGVAFDDAGAEKDPQWSFAVDAKEFSFGDEYSKTWLDGIDWFKAEEDPVIDVRVHYDYKEVLRVWADADYIMIDSGFAYDPSVITDAVDEIPVIEDSALINSASKDYFHALDISSEYSKNQIDTAAGWGKLYTGTMGTDFSSIVEETEISLASFEKSQYKTRTIVDADLYFNDSGIGFETMTPINVLGDDSFTVTEQPVINVYVWDHSLAKFLVSIHEEEAPVEYIFAVDFGYGVNEKGTVEVVGVDPATDIEYAIILTCNKDIAYVKDILSLFEKVSTDYELGVDYFSNIHVYGKDTADIVVEPVFSVFVKSEWGDYKDAINEFRTNFIDFNVETIERNSFDVFGEETHISYDTAILGVEVEDSFKEKEQVLEFYKGFTDIVLYHDEMDVVIPGSDTLTSNENGILRVAMEDYGEIAHKKIFGFKYFDKYSYKEDLVFSVPAEDSVVSSTSVTLMSMFIDSAEITEKMKYTNKTTLIEDTSVSFETVINLQSDEEFRSDESAIIGLFAEDISYVTFYCYIKGKEPPIDYIDVFEYGYPCEYNWINVLGEDAFALANDYAYITFSFDIDITSYIGVTKEFNTFESGTMKVFRQLDVIAMEYTSLTNESALLSFYSEDALSYKYFLKKEFNSFERGEGYEIKYLIMPLQDYFTSEIEWSDLNILSEDFFTSRTVFNKIFDQTDYGKFFYEDVFNTYVEDVVLVENEDAIIGHAMKEFFTPHLHFIKEFNAFEDGEHCYNTVVYDPAITFWDLMYWWEPGYAPGGKHYPGTDSLGIYLKPNKDWGKPLKPGDVDYPYYKNDREYGQEVPIFTDPINSYSAWVGDKSWIGDGSGEEKTVTSFSTKTLFTSYTSLIKFSTLHVDVIEYYMVTTSYIPWTTHFEIEIHAYHRSSSGTYYPLGSRLLVASKSIKSQTFIDGNKRKTVYYLNPSVKEINCYDLFPGYDLRQDYFVVTLTCTFSWTSTFYRGVVYKINAEYMYYGEYSTTNDLYIKSRRQIIYEDDDWFVVQAPLYYEPIIYKLYINMGCGLSPVMSRIPENPMDKYILDQMTKHPYLDIIAPFVGDHVYVEENPVISLFTEEIGKVRDHADIAYTLLFMDNGYTCEDVVVYSRDDFPDRDIMYWWEKGYPVVTDKTSYVPNQLLGKAIEVNDFDYPYRKSDAYYGDPVLPGKHGVPADYMPYKYGEHYNVPVETTIRYLFFPIRKLSDGMEVTLSGHVNVDIGDIELYFCVVRYADSILYSPYVFSSYPNVLLILKLAAVNTAVESISDTGEITYASASKIFLKEHFMLRSYDIYDYFNAFSIWPANEFYVGVLACVKPKYKYIDGTMKIWNYQIGFGPGVEEYDALYLSYRRPWMHPTDVGFVTRDFYNDFFGFKFYVNLGCGEDLDAFPIDFKDDFERWVFTTARLGNRNEDYLFVGDLGIEAETSLIELYRFWVIDVKFVVNFNSYEITVLESGLADHFAWNFIAADDYFSSADDAVIDIPYKEFGTPFSVVGVENRMSLYESGTFEVSQLMDLFANEMNETLNENYILSFANEEKGTLEFAVRFQCILNLFENALSAGQELLAIPINDVFMYADSSSITLPAAMEITAKDHEAIIAFKFVYDYGYIAGGQLLRTPIGDIFFSHEDPLVTAWLPETGVGIERVVPKRHEVYRDVGYICFWVQVVKYNYVIDWLAGHYVDYYHNPVEAEYIRYVSCYGVPPGDWKVPVVNYPDPEDIIPKENRTGLPEKDPHSGKYRPVIKPWYFLNPYHPVPRGRTGGYLIFIGPGNHITYIIDPVDPPKPYKWMGGTSILLTKSIRNSEMTEMLAVEDVFYFALFDEDGNRVSDVKMMSLSESMLEDGTMSPGASFGALVFFDLQPDTTYVIKETDKDGKILTKDLLSEFSGNKYSMPVDGLTVSTKEKGKCVDGGDMPNLVEKFGTHRPGGDWGEIIPDSGVPTGDNYAPHILIPGEGDPEPDGSVGGKAPFGIEDPIPGIDPTPYPIPILPVVDGPMLPDIVPDIIDPTPPDPNPNSGPGYVGKLVMVKETLRGRDILVENIPVDMLGRIWTYHYIPATFVLELTGIHIDYEDEFLFDFEEPFKFSFDEFSVEVEMPFAFETAEFSFEVFKEFDFDEEFILVETTQDVFIDETYFEIDAIFEDFQFDTIEYEGEQVSAAPEVVADVIVFDGLEHPLCSPRGEHGLIYYQLEGEDTWSKEIPKKTYVGQYTVRWYAMASLKYLAYGSKQDYHIITCMIQRANPAIDLENITLTYEETKEFTFIYTGDGIVSCAPASEGCSCEIVSQEEISDVVKPASTVVMRVTGQQAGPADIFVYSTQGPNFFKGEFVVKGMVDAATMRYKVESVKAEYTGKPIPCNNIQVFGPTQYEILYAPVKIDETTENKHKEVDFYIDVGDYTVYFEIAAKNYKPVYGKFILSIEYAVVRIVVVPFVGTFDYQTHVLISEVTGQRGTMWYSVDKENWYTKIPNGVMPGRYSVYWFCVGDVNHYDVGTKEQPNEVVAEIEKMDITDTMEDMVFDLNNPEEVTVMIPTASLGRLSITYTDYSVILASLSGKQVKIKPLKAGDTFVHIRQAEGLFYKEHVFSFHVDVIDTRIVYKIMPVTVKYAGVPVAPVGVEVIEPDPSVCKIRYSRMPITPETSDLLPEPPSFINVGIYNIYFVLSAYDYTPVYDFYTLTITPAENEAYVNEVMVDFDGKSHALAVPVPGYFGTIYYSTSDPSFGGEWSSTTPTAAMPGIYTIYWYCKGDSNHFDVGSRTNPFMFKSKINKLTYNPGTIFVDISLSQTEETVTLESPCTGYFDLIEYSTPEFIDPDGTYVENEPFGLLHIKPAAAGEFYMYITQHGDQIYNDVMFTVYVKIIS